MSKRLIRAFGVVLALAVIGQTSFSRVTADADDHGQKTFVGAWFVDVHPTLIPDFLSLGTFNSDGTLTNISSVSLGTPPESPGYGVWAKTGPNTYASTFHTIMGDGAGESAARRKCGRQRRLHRAAIASQASFKSTCSIPPERSSPATRGPWRGGGSRSRRCPERRRGLHTARPTCRDQIAARGSVRVDPRVRTARKVNWTEPTRITSPSPSGVQEFEPPVREVRAVLAAKIFEGRAICRRSGSARGGARRLPSRGTHRDPGRGPAHDRRRGEPRAPQATESRKRTRLREVPRHS